jgi:hypothetical protein
MSMNLPKFCIFRQFKKLIFLLAVFLLVINGLYAQTDFPASDFFSLNAGGGITGILIDGLQVQGIFDPQFSISPSFLVGSKLGASYNTEHERWANILTFEILTYFRWNFLRLGANPDKKYNIFIQGGVGAIAVYRGDQGGDTDNVDRNPYVYVVDRISADNSILNTKSFFVGDLAAGVTIPITTRWTAEVQIRGGYPHIFGASVTTGYKFRLPRKAAPAPQGQSAAPLSAENSHPENAHQVQQANGQQQANAQQQQQGQGQPNMQYNFGAQQLTDPSQQQQAPQQQQWQNGQQQQAPQQQWQNGQQQQAPQQQWQNGQQKAPQQQGDPQQQWQTAQGQQYQPQQQYQAPQQYQQAPQQQYQAPQQYYQPPQQQYQPPPQYYQPPPQQYYQPPPQQMWQSPQQYWQAPGQQWQAPQYWQPSPQQYWQPVPQQQWYATPQQQWGAAQQQPQTTRVSIIPSIPDPKNNQTYRLQVGSYRDIRNANVALKKVRDAGFAADIELH